MGEEQKNNVETGFSDVIDSIDKASKEELAALARIESKVSGTDPALESVTSGIPRSVQLARERTRDRENERVNTIKGIANSNNKTDEKPSNNNKTKSETKKQENNGNSAVKNTTISPPENNQVYSNNPTTKKQNKSSNSALKKMSRDDVLNEMRNTRRPRNVAGDDAKGRSRDGNGRFTSRDKIQQDSAKNQERYSKEEQREDQKRDALFTRIGKALSDMSDPMDADSTNAAGVAAGGSFWKAGHEAYSLGKNTLAGGLSGAHKMRDFLKGDREEDGVGAANKNPGIFRRMFTRGKQSPSSQNKRTSSSVIAAEAQREQVRATEKQTETIKTGDEKIVEKLDKLLDEKSGNKSSGLWGLLGAAALGKLGKKLLAGILSGIGAKALADRVRGGIGGRGRKEKSRRKGRGKGKRWGRDIESEIDDDYGDDLDPTSGVGTDARPGKKKRTRKEKKALRKRIKERKRLRSGKAGGKGVFGRLLGKKTLLAGGAAVAGLAAADAVAGELEDVADTTKAKPAGVEDKPAKPVSEAKQAVKAAQKAESSVASTVGEVAASATAGTAATAAGKAITTKTAGEAVAKGTEVAAKGTDVAAKSTTAAVQGAEAAGKKVAVKGAEEVGEKVATKTAEEVGAKAAGKVGLKVAGKTALRAIPVVGQVIGAGVDGVMGWQDKEGQQSAFNLSEGQEATKRQKAEYAAANIADMGGLVSGGASLLSKGASWLGLDGVAKKLSFSTDDIAKGIDSKVTAGKQAVKSATDFLGITSKDKAKEENAADDRTKTLVDAIKDGAKSTVDAISSLVSTAGNVAAGTVESVKGATSRFVAKFTQPTTDEISPELNIGGANAKNRNFRNNNFGNLNYVGQEGARLENANANGERRFARFDTPEEGIRALGNQLMSYSNGTSKVAGYKKLQSIDQIISLYAPKNENNTEAYKTGLAQQLGVGVNDTIDMKDPKTMTKMIRAISTMEGGNPQVTDKFFENALGKYQDSGNGKGKWVGQFNDSTLAIINKKRTEQGQDLLSKDAQFSGIATANGKTVDAVKAADVTPVAPVTQKNATVTTENGVNYRPAQLPLGIGQDSSLGKKLANAEGLRHQVGRSDKPTVTTQNQAKDQVQKQSVAQSENPKTSSAKAAAVSFLPAQLPVGDSTTLGQKLANAEGLRHQTSATTATAATSTAEARPNLAIPAKIPTVTGMTPSNTQPTVHVSNEQSFPKDVKATFEKIAKSLERIEGHTKDTAEKSGDTTTKANTPQPAPRSSTPLSINDPLMASVAND
ncbi:hypothetical protein [Enterobacter soli]|uniref:hypothetical protein n=1 Tax=Enterobacter soli TaxID=885040 RepID=UPI002F40ED2D